MAAWKLIELVLTFRKYSQLALEKIKHINDEKKKKQFRVNISLFLLIGELMLGKFLRLSFSVLFFC